MHMKLFLIITILLFNIKSNVAYGKSKNKTTGLLPELNEAVSNSATGEKMTAQSEAMISATEEKAIIALKNLIQKKKGTATESDLWFRLAELYLRRAKSGRYQDLQNKNPKTTNAAATQLRNAIDVYKRISRDFPKFNSMDAVIFNWAFCEGQLNQSLKSEELFKELIKKHPKSELVPDAHMALGELYYNRGDFSKALVELKANEDYPEHKIYPYSLYKQAWTLYNLKKNGEAISKLEQVMILKGAHNLRPEALRDLGLFFGETYKAEDAYAFFARITTEQELAESMISLGKLYASHSRDAELQIFLQDLIKKQPNSDQRIRAEILIMQSQENLKKRNLVLETMRESATICQPNSEWRKIHSSIASQECDDSLAKAHLEIVKKWWDLWSKNKNNKEISSLTTDAFEIQLQREDKSNPDTKSRYAYAELLFQQKKFRKASEQYKQVSDSIHINESIKSNEKSKQQTVTKEDIGQDSAYSAIVALEEAIKLETNNDEKKANTDDIQLQMQLCQSYLQRYPQGTQTEQVQYKYGFLSYLNKDYTLALKTLSPLSTIKTKDVSISDRSQDLILDIYNIQKEISQLAKKAKEFGKLTANKERKDKFSLIARQAEIADIENSIEKNPTRENILKLEQFSKDNSADKNLSSRALMQAMRSSFAHDYKFSGASLALKMSQSKDNKLSDNKELIPALKDAVQFYYDHGFFDLAETSLIELSKRQEGKELSKTQDAIIDIAKINKNASVLQNAIRQALKQNPSEENKTKYYQYLQESTSFPNSPLSLQQVILEIREKNIQPFAAQYELNEIEKKLQENKLSEVFEKSKKFVGGNYPDSIKAQARFLQAQVLEKEMLSQSTKTDINRLTVVLSLKTEKLDKAQTGYLAAASYSNDSRLQTNVLLALDRLYADYISKIKNIQIKDKLTPEETSELQNELAKLIKPIEKKREDNQKKISQLKVAQPNHFESNVNSNSFELPSEVDPYPAPSGTIESKNFNLPYADITSENQVNILRNKPSGDCIKIEKLDAHEYEKKVKLVLKNINNCFEKNNDNLAEESIELLSETEQDLGLTPFSLGLLALKKGQNEKALILAQLAIKKSSYNSLYLYLKALAHANANNFDNEFIDSAIKASDLGLTSLESTILYSLAQYKKENCLTVIEKLEKVDARARINSYADLIYSECLAQNGQTSQATEILKKSTSGQISKQKFILAELQIARIYERFIRDNVKARAHYEEAYKKNIDDLRIKTWIKNKIEWLKVNTQSANSGL